MIETNVPGFTYRSLENAKGYRSNDLTKREEARSISDAQTQVAPKCILTFPTTKDWKTMDVVSSIPSPVCNVKGERR